MRELHDVLAEGDAAVRDPEHEPVPSGFYDDFEPAGQASAAR
jgi:hypothetical protein